MIIAYMLVSTRQGKLKLVSTALRKLEPIKELHEVYGRFDIVLKVEFEDLSKLKEFIQNKIQIVEGIAKTETLLVNDLDDASPMPEES
ncbi:MAG TPA: Lrp/AsnC ligand binding domain-containing protein [Candidatus Nanoarchaeia archaeon]|nr:Lrp/AsnC ligand binding domain-containing protein [Candidatus Nanoarchaeia archaeon]